LASFSHHLPDRVIRRSLVPDQPERPKTAKELRLERSAAALRANLRRRKEQRSQREDDCPAKAVDEGDVTPS